MKKHMISISLFLILSLLMTACGTDLPGKNTTETQKNNNSYTAEEVQSFLTGLPSVEDILQWTDGVAAEALPETLATEEYFETDTTDHQGNPVHLTHYYEEDTEGLYMESDQYRTVYDHGAAEAPTGIFTASTDGITSAGYELQNGSYALSTAFFYGPDSYDLWSSDGNTICLAKKATSVKVSDTSVFSDTGNGVIFYKCGGHTLCFTENGADHDWYLTTDFYVAFKDQTEAEAYAAAHGLEAAPWEYDENTYVVSPGALTVGLSKDFKNLSTLIVETFDPTDATTFAVTFDKNEKAVDAESKGLGLPLN